MPGHARLQDLVAPAIDHAPRDSGGRRVLARDQQCEDVRRDFVVGDAGAGHIALQQHRFDQVARHGALAVLRCHFGTQPLARPRHQRAHITMHFGDRVIETPVARKAHVVPVRERHIEAGHQHRHEQGDVLLDKVTFFFQRVGIFAEGERAGDIDGEKLQVLDHVDDAARACRRVPAPPQPFGDSGQRNALM